LKTEPFPLSLSLKNSKKPKAWFGTRWSVTWGSHAECWILAFLGKREGEEVGETIFVRPLGIA
jgi:hypothetical protein